MRVLLLPFILSALIAVNHPNKNDLITVHNQLASLRESDLNVPGIAKAGKAVLDHFRHSEGNNKKSDLQLLSSGSLKLPAEIVIGKSAYMINRHMPLSPNYMGHPVNDTSTAVLIRTNHILGMFDRPDVYMNQLIRTKDSGILLDYDSKYSIIVTLDVHNLKLNTASLATTYLIFPKYAMIGNEIYVITHKREETVDYRNYHAYQRRNSKNVVHVKAFLNRDRFKVELDVLKKLNRLLNSDLKKMVLVSQVFSGNRLSFLLNNMYAHPDYVMKAIENIDSAIIKFHKKWNMSHGNINAHNIIVNRDGTIDFVNFEYSQNYSGSNQSNEELLKNDLKAAHHSLEFAKELISALNSPLSVKSQGFLRKYVSDMALHHGLEIVPTLWNEISRKQHIEYIKTNGAPQKLSSDFIVGVFRDWVRGGPQPAIHIHIGINDYVITDYIAAGAQGSTFRAYLNHHPNERVVIKLYHDIEAFLPESRALIVLGRLYDKDSHNFMTVQKEIPGELLSRWFSKQNDISSKSLFKMVTELLTDFHAKWGMAHFDVRPQNIIMKPDGSLELIDFGFTKILSDDEFYEEQITRDFEIARFEFSFYFLSLDAKTALDYPHDPESESIIRKYMEMLNRRGDHDKARFIWRKFMRQYKTFKPELKPNHIKSHRLFDN